MTSSCPFLFETKVTFDGNCHVDGELQIWYQTSRKESNFHRELITKLTFRAFALRRHFPNSLRSWRLGRSSFVVTSSSLSDFLDYEDDVSSVSPSSERRGHLNCLSPWGRANARNATFISLRWKFNPLSTCFLFEIRYYSKETSQTYLLHLLARPLVLVHSKNSSRRPWRWQWR